MTLPGRTSKLCTYVSLGGMQCAGPGDRLDPTTHGVSRATTKARETRDGVTSLL